MLDLVRKHKILVSDHGARRSDDAGFLVQAVATEEEIERLEGAGYTIRKFEDVDEYGRARQLEVGKGNRYKPSGSS
jgi:hypothetical protein